MTTISLPLRAIHLWRIPPWSLRSSSGVGLASSSAGRPTEFRLIIARGAVGRCETSFGNQSVWFKGEGYDANNPETFRGVVSGISDGVWVSVLPS
mmetsp:Transcript_11646/g.25685  ORF Transcript_11646/g.25685 Transcript_11646/m.25685 type:complete len:95 (-) Transcript_11646:3551-3835(-)